MRILAACLTAALSATPVVRAAESDACPPTPVQKLTLPQMRTALDTNRDVIIVALGSSSTRGHLASDRAHSYPAVLQRRLTQLLPFAHVAVINRGIGGQDAGRELARIEADAIDLRPALVVWQVGANGALHHADPVLFRRLVMTGVRRMMAAGIDVVLMDNQRAPRILATGMDGAIEQDLREVARATGASLFSRERLMDAWDQAGFPYALFLSGDGLHHNDRGYRCVARALARAIAAGVSQLPRAQAAGR